MLSLHSTTPDRWLEQVDAHLDEILVDHAHCEKKAASTAMNLLFAYGEDLDLSHAMSDIVLEELSHFHLVVNLLARRGIRFRRLTPSHYGRRLNDLVRRQEPARAVDRLLVAGLIEARSCERFDLLRRHMRGRDEELADFYENLFESEARHHASYVRLAKHFASDAEVQSRLAELAAAEAVVVSEGDARARMHS